VQTAQAALWTWRPGRLGAPGLLGRVDIYRGSVGLFPGKASQPRTEMIMRVHTYCIPNPLFTHTRTRIPHALLPSRLYFGGIRWGTSAGHLRMVCIHRHSIAFSKPRA
jgi:hypothetical protein